MVAGLLFFWGAGEELSWGQHILKFGTPDWLAEINGQRETNLHNINKKFFDRTYERLVLLLAVSTTFLHVRLKSTLLGFQVPGVLLNLAFLVLPICRRFHHVTPDVWQLGGVAFAFYALRAVKSRDREILAACAMIVFTVPSVAYLNWHYGPALDSYGTNIFHEVRETAFAFLCLVYALQLSRATRSHTEAPETRQELGPRLAIDQR